MIGLGSCRAGLRAAKIVARKVRMAWRLCVVSGNERRRHPMPGMYSRELAQHCAIYLVETAAIRLDGRRFGPYRELRRSAELR